MFYLVRILEVEAQHFELIEHDIFLFFRSKVKYYTDKRNLGH